MKPGRIANRFPQTARQLDVLRLLAAVDDPNAWTFFDRHKGKAAGGMARSTEYALVDTTYDAKESRFRYRITSEGRKALARVEAEESERLKRYDPFGPQQQKAQR